MSVNPMQERKYASAKVDIIFKKVFGSDKNKDCLIALLNALLEIDIRDVKILNPELPDAALPDLKNVRLDILAELEDLSFINIEMQVGAQWYFASRALFYWAKIYATQLEKGGDYAKLFPVYGIYILDFSCFANNEQSMHHFVLKESHSNESLFKTNEMMKLIFVELSKFKELDEVPKNKLATQPKLDLWLTFLKTVSDSQMEELKMADSNLAKAVSELELAAMKPEERRLYFSRMEGLSDYKSDLRASALQGKAEGLSLAIAEVCKIRFQALEPKVLESLSGLNDIQLSLVLKHLLLAPSHEAALSILNQPLTLK